MKRTFAGITVILAFSVLSGCATMSGDECAVSDWTAVGYSDGARGYTSDQLSKYNKACAKHGVTPDFRAYQSGREEGLREFCQPGNGFSLGERGGRYHGVCSPDLEPHFLDAYRVGSHLYSLRSNVNSASSRIAHSERELENTKDEIRHKEALLIDEETTTTDRVLLLADLKDLSERIGQLESEIRTLYDERARHEVELQNYQASVTAYGY
jgi:hypothetical protein